jgi:hypothetical protein
VPFVSMLLALDHFQDMKITFTRSDSSARDQMTALYFTIYLDGSPYFGFSVSEGWCEEIFMAGSREWVDGEDLSSPLRFGTLVSCCFCGSQTKAAQLTLRILDVD